LNIERQFEHYKQFKRKGESSSPQLNSYNRFHILADHVMQAGILDQEKSGKNRKTILREEKAKKKKKKKMKDVRKVEEELLREVTIKIRLERIDMQEKIMVEVLLNSGAIGLVISSEFAKKQ